MFLDKCKTCLAHFFICDTSFFNDSLSFLYPSRLVIQNFNLEYRNLRDRTERNVNPASMLCLYLDIILTHFALLPIIAHRPICGIYGLRQFSMNIVKKIKAKSYKMLGETIYV